MEENVAHVFKNEKQMGAKGEECQGSPRVNRVKGGKRFKGGLVEAGDPDPELDRKGLG